MKARERLKVGVLCGGIGGEREVSLSSGRCVAEALEDGGFEAEFLDTGPGNCEGLKECGCDVFFVAMHGEFGEDGQLQRILEGQGLVYTGSGAEACEAAFDKMVSKGLFGSSGIRIPRGVRFGEETSTDVLSREVGESGGRFVVKPTRQGSSVGVRIVRGAEEALAAARATREEFGESLIEEYIAGKELAVGIVEGEALPIVEVRTGREFYDYEAKYSDDETAFFFGTVSDTRLVEQIEAGALECYRRVGCRHFARVDFILGANGVPYVLELNTIPGLTSHSLLPKAARQGGMGMSELCVRIVKAALRGSKRSVKGIKAGDETESERNKLFGRCSG